jgi:hypothetical protein
MAVLPRPFLLLLVVLMASCRPAVAQPFVGRDDAGNVLINTPPGTTLLVNGLDVPTCNCTAIQTQASSVSDGLLPPFPLSTSYPPLQLSAATTASFAQLSSLLASLSTALTTVNAGLDNLNATINAESTRAMTRETAISTAVVSESSRASTAEASLSTSTKALNTSLSTAISAETSRALAVELSLGTPLTDLNTAACTALLLDVSRFNTVHLQTEVGFGCD